MKNIIKIRQIIFTTAFIFFFNFGCYFSYVFASTASTDVDGIYGIEYTPELLAVVSPVLNSCCGNNPPLPLNNNFGCKKGKKSIKSCLSHNIKQVAEAEYNEIKRLKKFLGPTVWQEVEARCPRNQYDAVHVLCLEWLFYLNDSEFYNFVLKNNLDVEKTLSILDEIKYAFQKRGVLSYHCQIIAGALPRQPFNQKIPEKYLTTIYEGGAWKTDLKYKDPLCDHKIAPSKDLGSTKKTVKRPDEVKVNDPTNPVVKISFLGIDGYSEYKCSEDIVENACAPAEDSEWNKTKKPLKGFKSILFDQLADHSILTLAELYIGSLALLNPEKLLSNKDVLKQRKKDFFEAASCFFEDKVKPKKYRKQARQKVLDLFNNLKLPTGAKKQEFIGQVTQAREEQGKRLHYISKEIAELTNKKSVLDPLFTHQGKCGYLPGQATIDVKNQCIRHHYKWTRVKSSLKDLQGKYPYLSMDLTNPAWRRIATKDDSSGAFALSVYDDLIQRTNQSQLDRVSDICDKPQKAGKAALFNPLIAQSFLRDTSNQEKGWVMCAAYAQYLQNQSIKNFGLLMAAAISVPLTGGVSGVAASIGAFGLTAYMAVDEWEQMQRQKGEFLAGVGYIDDFMHAQEALDSFLMRQTAYIALDIVGVTAEAVMLRSWMKARRLRLARTSGALEIPKQFQGKLSQWYRHWLSRITGVKLDELKAILTEDELIKLAVRHESGAIRIEDLRGMAVSCGI